MPLDRRMLEELGIENVEELFSDIPEKIRIEGIPLPQGKSEMEVIRTVQDMLSKNLTAEQAPCFLGGGIYHHFIPSAVSTITSRSEFLTSYTPYQAEISQGMLQSMFEYQSMISELTAMDVVNSSNYDWSTALGEAATMCHRILPKKTFLVPEAMSWEKRSVLRNYVSGPELNIVEYSYDPYTGEADLEDIRQKMTHDVCGLYIEVPNLFGIIDSRAPLLKKEFPEVPLVVGVNPLSLALVRPPGEYGADIVIGEGQSLGLPMNVGGPLLGLFACTLEHVRKMPGRLIGLTKDNTGRRAFCMTLQTREQHIRRSKATSNICTNEALLAIAVSAYLGMVGSKGLRALARINMRNARSLMQRIDELDGFTSPFFNGAHFNEFVVKTTVRPEKLNKLLLRHGIIGGMPMHRHLPRLNDHMLLTTTEMNSAEDIDRLIVALKEVVQ
ncbi:MAG TPA: aminomethyl-transferring glycine dehydrogenase subunit GcvPA [Methanomassiliicoccales archaeon]|nr:aminomethyl-transferring glycine dehydrogenase subunit GcvPA [Methanomassiliicoccales archaeon]